MDTKRCSRCGEDRTEEEWQPSWWSRSGGWCKPCRAAYHRERYTPKLPPKPTAPPGKTWCTKCHEIKPNDEFYLKADGKPRMPCKACYAQWHRNRYTPKNGADDAPRACAWCETEYRPKQRRASICCSRSCLQKARDASPRRRDQLLRSKYGITAVDYDALLTSQNDGCAICEDRGETSRGGILHVDHCHDTGRVRGLLCETCNLALGAFKDNPALLRRAADYLDRQGELSTCMPRSFAGSLTATP